MGEIVKMMTSEELERLKVFNLTFSLYGRRRDIFSFKNYNFSKFRPEPGEGVDFLIYINLPQKKPGSPVEFLASSKFTQHDIFYANYKKVLFKQWRGIYEYRFIKKADNCSNFSVLFDPKSRSCHIYPDENKPIMHPFDFIPKWYLQNYLYSTFKGLFVHGCCIKKGSKGFLFLGHSGSGKTTIARYCRRAGFTVLNDENIILSNIRKKVIAYSTPWSIDRDMVDNNHVAINRVFFLRFGKDDFLDRVEQGRVVSYFLPHLLSFGYDQILFQRIIASLVGISQSISFYRMTFRKTGDFIGLLDRQL